MKTLPDWWPKWGDKLDIDEVREELVPIPSLHDSGSHQRTVNGTYFDSEDEPLIALGGTMLYFDRKENCWKYRGESFSDPGVRAEVRSNGKVLPPLEELDLINADLFPKKGDEVRVTLVTGDVIVETVKRVDIDRKEGQYAANIKTFPDCLDREMGISYYAPNEKWRFSNGRGRQPDVAKVEVKRDEFWEQVPFVRPEVLECK